jgi:hypothetical protein
LSKRLLIVILIVIGIPIAASIGIGHKPSQGLVLAAASDCSTCTWTGTVTSHQVSDTHRESPHGHDDTIIHDAHRTADFTSDDLILALDLSATPVPGQQTYLLVSGSLTYTVSGNSSSSSNGHNSSCTYSASGTLDLHPGDAKLTIFDDGQGATYVIDGESESTTFTEETNCTTGGAGIEDEPLGLWFTTGDDPIAFDGGPVISGTNSYNTHRNHNAHGKVLEITASGNSTWQLTSESLEVNSNGDEGDAKLDDGACDVDLTHDGLQCTFRAAIETATLSPDVKRIAFNISGNQAIQPLAPLPQLADDIDVDGTTQPGTGAVVLDGSAISEENIAALFLAGSNIRVRGLVLIDWNKGIYIEGGGQNIIQGNYIGTDAAGLTSAGNEDGVDINGSRNNLVGGTSLSQQNVIGANSNAGIVIYGEGSDDNIVTGNLIGVGPDGQDVGNGVGVRILQGQRNFIGDKKEGAGNVISFNQGDGVQVNAPARENVVVFNIIGETTDGQAAGNGGDGVFIDGAKDNLIGSDVTEWGNVIGNNVLAGVQVRGADAVGNSIVGNYIGIDEKGFLAGNQTDGVIVNGAPDVQIGGPLDNPDQHGANYIGGNERYGIYLISPNTHGTQVLANVLGLNTKSELAPNTGDNIHVENSWSNNIGAPGLGNMIVASKGDGIEIAGGDAYNNAVSGNLIGTDGTDAIPNEEVGVAIVDAPANVIGGSTPEHANVISGNTVDGVYIQGETSTGNFVINNLIGVLEDDTTVTPLGNGQNGIEIVDAPDNSIGSSQPGLAGNLISANGQNGILLRGPSHPVTHTFIGGNHIGTDSTGQVAQPNGASGISLQSGTVSNFIGGVETNWADFCGTPCNVISANAQNGIELSGAGTGNLIQGNVIGLKDMPECLDALQPLSSFGDCDLGNAGAGVLIENTNNTYVNAFAESLGCTGTCNLIAFNGTGIAVTGSSHTARIYENSVFSNSINVDLGGDGITPNDGAGDTWDTDSGPNELQNFPEVLSALDKGTDAVVTLTLHSRANSRFGLDFYVSETCSDSAPSAQVYAGSAGIMTDSAGEVSNQFILEKPPGDQWAFVTVTAGDSNNNISELSACAPLVADETELAESGDAGDEQIGVVDTSGVQPGDEVRIGTGANQETHGVVATGGNIQSVGAAAAGTLALDGPLLHGHAIHEAVVVVGGKGPGTDVVWGDIDCSGAWSPSDALTLLRLQAGLTPNAGACPALGAAITKGGTVLRWGDMDDSGAADSPDVLVLLRHASALDEDSPRWLPRVGAIVRITTD